MYVWNAEAVVAAMTAITAACLIIIILCELLYRDMEVCDCAHVGSNRCRLLRYDTCLLFFLEGDFFLTADQLVLVGCENAGNQGIFIAQDENFNGLTTKIPVGFIEDNGRRLVNAFRTDIRQISVSAEAYRFLRLVKQQTEISGSVFDPPPASIRGNMISLDNPDEVVLGYFMAGGEARKRIYIKYADLTFNQPRDIIPDDCKVFAGPNSDLPPADWNPND